MFNDRIDMAAGGALAYITSIESAAREMIPQILAVFSEGLPGAELYFDKETILRNLAQIKDLADRAAAAVETLPDEDKNPDNYPPDPPENIAAEYGPNCPPW